MISHLSLQVSRAYAVRSGHPCCIQDSPPARQGTGPPVGAFLLLTNMRRAAWYSPAQTIGCLMSVCFLHSVCRKTTCKVGTLRRASGELCCRVVKLRCAHHTGPHSSCFQYLIYCPTCDGCTACGVPVAVTNMVTEYGTSIVFSRVSLVTWQPGSSPVKVPAQMDNGSTSVARANNPVTRPTHAEAPPPSPRPLRGAAQHSQRQCPKHAARSAVAEGMELRREYNKDYVDGLVRADEHAQCPGIFVQDHQPSENRGDA